LEALGINLGYLLVQIGSFIILFLVLTAWAYKPILGLLENRRNAIAKGLEDAHIAGEARANAESDAASIIAEAQAKAAHIVNGATERADMAALEVKADAENQIMKERETALAEAYQERDRILGEVRGQVAALAIAAAQKLIGIALDEKRQRALIDEFFSGVKAGRVTVLEDAALTGTGAEVTSALPLTEEERAVVRGDVLARLDPQAKVNFRIDPAILGGLVIQAGGKVMDASIAGQLAGLRHNLG
jgi:F-type H+-transporting ATPase subunit b